MKILTIAPDTDKETAIIDWRRDALTRTMQITPWQLTDKQQAQILSLMTTLGLRFGCLDFIVTPQNELVFLEVNEQGQFLFLDQRCPTLDVLGAMCRFLSNEAGINSNFQWPSFAQYLASRDNALREQQAEAIAAQNNDGIKFTFAGKIQ